ncbi:hypothetical protein GCM10010282_19070 [Streptomyces roseolus]|nr:hypothetical protein GCM10010282_19070 [Streptomyces roseolus]
MPRCSLHAVTTVPSSNIDHDRSLGDEPAARPGAAPATVGLMAGDPAKKGILERREAPADRRRKTVSIAEERRDAVDGRLGRGADARRAAPAPWDRPNGGCSSTPPPRTSTVRPTQNNDGNGPRPPTAGATAS